MSEEERGSLRGQGLSLRSGDESTDVAGACGWPEAFLEEGAV